MEDEENFDELISKLDSLGINTRDIRSTIWRLIEQEVDLKAVSYVDDKARIVLDIGLDKSYRTCLFDFTVYYRTAGERSHVQKFNTDVPLSEAKNLLQLRVERNIEERLHAYKPMSRKEVIHELNTLNQNVMNTQNLEFLQKTLKNLGFGDEVNFALEDAMKAKEKSLTFFIEKDINGRYISYDLHFKAGDKQDMYFFNSYDAQLEKGVNEKDIKQTFYINKGSGITAKEAFNLMDGRAVHKQLFNLEGQKYHAWLTLDPNNLTENGNMKIKHYHENYGFDLEKTITDKGIKELEDPKSKQDLLYSLKKGNIQQITVAGKEGDQKYYIAANPQFKTVDLYDSQMKKIKREVLLQPEQKAVKSVKQKEQQKEELPAKKQSRKKGMTV